ncbi:oxidoreductase [Fusarium bulbicola]|nr:oxidoreductase [Fusarium bulbicola]
MVSSKSQQFFHTSGVTDSVWVHQDPVSNRPSFSKLSQDIETDVCVIGGGIGGISTAYELVTRGREVVLLEARQVLSGETGRTSGHLTNDLDDGYTEIVTKHGDEGARAAAESHAWGRDRVGEISKMLGIECEYHKLPAYEVSQYSTKDAKEHEDEMNDLRKEEAAQRKFGIDARFDESLTVRGWDGAIDQRGGLIVKDQATFHPTKYLNGILNWLKTQPNFRCFDETRVISVEEKAIEDLGRGMGGAGSKPIAVYKDEEGNVKQYSALCPHMKGVVCWNTTEKSFDCPVHGSRFSREGICVMGPSKRNSDPVDEPGKADQENVAGS